MTKQELINEVRRFFPHARVRCRRGWLIVRLRHRANLSVDWFDPLLIDGQVVVNGGWWACLLSGGSARNVSRDTPAEALRALGFAPRTSAESLPTWQQLKMARDGRNACPLQSRQRQRKGARLGTHKRRKR